MFQQSLFSDSKPPENISLIPDFISEIEEAELLRHFEKITWQKVQMHGVTAKRRVAHYGLDYTYTKRTVQETDPAPPWLGRLTTRAATVIDRPPADLKEILVSYYPAGSGIGWHKDAEVFGDAIVGVSFLSDCVMKFKNPETAEVYSLFIPRRSAYVFSGPARWQWTHSIANHSKDRYSVTFRTLLQRK